jgi:hypothetical protein
MHLRRIDPDRNMARFYSMSVQPNLFGEWLLFRVWGRIGSPGRSSQAASPPSAPSLWPGGTSESKAQRRLRGSSSDMFLVCQR